MAGKDNTIQFEAGLENAISLIVVNEQGKELIAYHKRDVPKRNRKLTFEPKQPEEIESANELELIGEHLELYRHPIRYPEPYWKEAITKDPKSYKCYIALGRVELKKGKFTEAEKDFRTAINIMTTFQKQLR